MFMALGPFAYVAVVITAAFRPDVRVFQERVSVRNFYSIFTQKTHLSSDLNLHSWSRWLL